ncbi:hypothetical protein [Aeromonas simiae]|uniref:hypothetical protein n=1 Tax=Aeromonas simiae TaxID=218936 RepID=UPI001866CB99|nr:hypothetical protein [Aeromonas simiae]
MSAFERGDGYSIQTLKFQCQELGLDPSLLPRRLLEITSEARTCRHPDPNVGYERVVYFKPETHEHILRAEIFAIEAAKICEEERQKQQEQGENHERE